MKQDKFFYAKFIKDQRLKVATAFFCSPNLEATKKHKTDEEAVPEKEGKNTSTPTKIASFADLTQDFFLTIDSFQRMPPALMLIMPMFVKAEIEVKLRYYFKTHGKVLEENDELVLFEIDQDHAGKIDQLATEVTSLQAGVSNLPNMLLLGLISAYDAFFSRLLKLIFLTKPEIISASERNITFKELVEIGSVDSAREKILEKEVESVLRNSHQDQLKWLENKLGMPLSKDLNIYSDFIELCERRNLFTHTAGVVSSQYLEVCKNHGCNIEGLKVGDQLEVTAKYFQDKVNLVFELGIKLIQVVWRKLLPDEIDDAATHLNQIGFKLIGERKYKLASILLDFGLYTLKKQGNDLTKKMMVVNLANAKKLLDKKDESKTILESEDWSAVDNKFHIAIAAVNDDVDKVVSLMKSVKEANLMNKHDFREWPVFTNLRKDKKFQEEFEKIFGEPFFTLKKEVSSSASAKAEIVLSSGEAENISENKLEDQQLRENRSSNSTDKK